MGGTGYPVQERLVADIQFAACTFKPTGRYRLGWLVK